MTKNLGWAERVARGVLGWASIAIGLSAGRRSWWGIALDAVGLLLVFSATTGFCHVQKVVSELRAASSR